MSSSTQTTTSPPITCAAVHRWSDSAEIMAAHPPQFRSKKLAIFLKAVPEADSRPKRRGKALKSVEEAGGDSGLPTSQPLILSRWRPDLGQGHLPALAGDGACTSVSMVQGIFQYGQCDGSVHWHVNFANAKLFGYYYASVLAQDELQVLEHPVLGSIRETLKEEGHECDLIVTEPGSTPTPICVSGAERRLHFHTERARGEGRERGLYGINFTQADERVVVAATEVLPRMQQASNILAIEAPMHAGKGPGGAYTKEMIGRILTIAYTGFEAVRLHTATFMESMGAGVVIHTGFWGCGAYGGNRVLMTVLQILAARLCGASLVFYTVDAAGSRDYRAAMEVIRKVGMGEGTGTGSAAAAAAPVDSVIDRLVGMKFKWR